MVNMDNAYIHSHDRLLFLNETIFIAQAFYFFRWITTTKGCFTNYTDFLPNQIHVVKIVFIIFNKMEA